LAAVLASWERTSDVKQKGFQETRDCQPIAGFLFFNIPRKEKCMNSNKILVPTEFGPETRFEVRANPPAPFRALLENEFERLKNKLLAQQLLAAAPELNAPLRRAANDAAALAWATVFPLLVFPVLFEEKTRAAIKQAKRQAHIYADSRELIAV
jgi:hypothetical protein